MAKKPRPPVTDAAAVRLADGSFVVSRSLGEVVDLISEGPIEGIVSGKYATAGEEGETGYQSIGFTHYTATGKAGGGTSLAVQRELGFLRSVYWNEIPVVDDDGFYNFQDINLEFVNGSPIGHIPQLNTEMGTDTAGKVIGLDLSVNRSIGDRLYGPEIDPNEDRKPGSKAGESARLKPGSRIDKYARTYTVLNKECTQIDVNIKIPGMFENLQSGSATYKKSKYLKACRKRAAGKGDTKAYTVEYWVYYQPMFDSRFEDNKIEGSFTGTHDPKKWIGPVKEVVQGKIDSPYIRTTHLNFDKYNFKDQEGFQGWKIRIARLTPESITSFIQSRSFVDSLVEVFGCKMRYPYSSMVYTQFDAKNFSRLPSRAYDTKLLKVKVPNNYNPILKTYGTSTTDANGFQDGIAKGNKTNSGYSTTSNTWTKNDVVNPQWDGGFATNKLWTDNPAWCFYDLVTNPRYGLGEYISENEIDKWALYEIAQYCDKLVDDGYGALEPQFTINYIITSREEAFKVLNDLASIFRGITYFANGLIFATQDKFKLPIYQFNNSNVANGNFTYASSAKRARHTVAIVRYNDKRDWFKPAVEYVEDEEAVRRYGIREIQTSALGCTSRGQARRFARWILASESQETETVSFGVGHDGAYLAPGDIVQIYDNYRNALKYSGRTNATRPIVQPSLTQNGVPNFQTDFSNFALAVNSVVLDQALSFTHGQTYKLSLLTPTYSFDAETVGLNSSQAEDLRRSAVQTVYFLGKHTRTVTGDYRSDFLYGGSGVCTEIYFDSGLNNPQASTVFVQGLTGNQLDFENYVITGYTNTNVQPYTTEEPTPYSGGCVSGENLIWSIEPEDPNSTEFISGSFSNYRVINISEKENSYDISALAYSTGKYDDVTATTTLEGAEAARTPIFSTGVRDASDADARTWSASEGETLPMSLEAGSPVVADGSYFAKALIPTIEITFERAGFNFVGGEDNFTPPVDPDPTISYIVCVADGFTTATADANPPFYGTYKPTKTYNLYTTDPALFNEYYKDNIKLSIPAGESQYVKKNKLYVELFIEEKTWQNVTVFAISQRGRMSQGMTRIVQFNAASEGDLSIVRQNTINDLRTEGKTDRGRLDSLEPAFSWRLGLDQAYYTTAPAGGGSANESFPHYPIYPAQDATEYRITVRAPATKGADKKPSPTPNEKIYVEFTGYTSPGLSGNFSFDGVFNDPDTIIALQNDPDYTNHIKNQKGQNPGFIEVTGSGFNIRNTPNEFPLREFDLVVESHDGQGKTSAGNLCGNGTVNDGKTPDAWGDDGTFDTFGVDLAAPSGVFFAQTKSNEKEGPKFSRISIFKAYENKYPYVLYGRAFTDGKISLSFTESANREGSIVQNMTIDKIEDSFENVRGLVWYASTGDNSLETVKIGEDEEKTTTITRLANPAPTFSVSKDNVEFQDSNPNNKSRVGNDDNKYFGGIISPAGGTDNNTYFRGYYVMKEEEDIENIMMPFPLIADPDAQNIQLTIGFFDTLSLAAYFDDDEVTPRYMNDNLTPKIFADSSITFSTLPLAETSKYISNKGTLWRDDFANIPGTPIFLAESSNLAAGDVAGSFQGWYSVMVQYRPGNKDSYYITPNILREGLRTENGDDMARLKIIGKDSDYMTREEIEVTIKHTGKGSKQFALVRVMVPLDNCDVDKYSVFTSPIQYRQMSTVSRPTMTPVEDPWDWAGTLRGTEIDKDALDNFAKSKLTYNVLRKIPQYDQRDTSIGVGPLDPLLYAKTNDFFVLLATVPLPKRNASTKPVAFQINFGFLRTDE